MDTEVRCEIVLNHAGEFRFEGDPLSVVAFQKFFQDRDMQSERIGKQKLIGDIVIAVERFSKRS